MSIRLAFFDIDGTLLDKSGRYSSATLAAIRRIRAQGVKTAIASGRPLFAAKPLIEALGIVDAGCYFTGALVQDPVSGEVLSSTELPLELAEQVLCDARELDLYCEVYHRDRYFIEVESEISCEHARHLRAEPALADLSCALEGAPVYKLLLGVNLRERGDRVRELALRYPQLTFASAYLPSYPDWHFASVIDKRACKRRAFQTLLDFHGVRADQVISFGDAEADMDFVELAGIGVAMGNASEPLKAVADYVTDCSWDDGVAKALQQFVPAL